jgi:hypothetical protein
LSASERAQPTIKISLCGLANCGRVDKIWIKTL